MQAKARYDYVAIKAQYEFEGKLIIEVACLDYDTFKALPNAVEVNGRLLSKLSWNSDTFYACYKTGGLLAKVV